MGVLKNPRHEKFAQLLAQGFTADAAYQEAGYKRHRGSASRLCANANVQARVQELQEKSADLVVLSRADVLAGLAENARLARELGQISASNQAFSLYGKELGMFVDRRLLGVRRVEDMSEEELLEFLGGEPEPEELSAAAGTPPVGHA